jgi:hypothetical protein
MPGFFRAFVDGFRKGRDEAAKESAILFTGQCSFCAHETNFGCPNVKDTVIAMTRFGIGNPLNAIGVAKSLAGDFGRIGKCKNCGEIVLQCPRCGSINRREFDPMPCIKCGKKYSHP